MNYLIRMVDFFYQKKKIIILTLFGLKKIFQAKIPTKIISLKQFLHEEKIIKNYKFKDIHKLLIENDFEKIFKTKMPFRKVLTIFTKRKTNFYI